MKNSLKPMQFLEGQLSIITPFEVYVTKIALEGESHKNDIH